MISIPGYEIVRELGQGGMSTVYLAIQTSLNREVALKIMTPALSADETAGARFLKEARTVAQLSHPNIIAVYDVGCVEKHHFIAMEYVDGTDLKQKIITGLDPETSIWIVAQMANALGHAHAKGFIHRDIKPQNILFRRDGAPVLTDFGIALAVDAMTRMTMVGSSVGTPRYMSPEQAQGKPDVDHRTDLYSLGIVFYEMLTGQVPYDAETSIAIAIKHIQDPLPELPPEFAKYRRIINGLLAKEPERRFQDAATLIKSLNGVGSGSSDESPTQVLSSQPTEVLTIPTLGEVEASGTKAGENKPSGRKTLFVALGGVLTAMALGGLLIFANGWNKKSKAPAIGGRTDEPISLTPKKNASDAAGKISTDAAPHAADLVPGAAGDGMEQAREDVVIGDGADQGTPANQAGQTPAKIPRQKLLQRINDLLDRQEFAAAHQEMVDATAAYAGDKDFERFAEIYDQLAKIFEILRTDTVSITGYGGPMKALLADIKQAEPEYGLSRTTMDLIEQRYVKEAQSLADRQQIAKASRTCEDGLAVFPDNQALRQLRHRLEEQSPAAEKGRIAALLKKAAGYFQNRQNTTPKGSNALDTYREVLRLDPGNQEATAGITQIVEQYRKWAKAQQIIGGYAAALNFIDTALKITPKDKGLLALRTELQAHAAEHRAELELKKRIADLLASANNQLSKADFDPVQKNHPSIGFYRLVLQLEPNNQDALDGLQNIARMYARLASKAYVGGAKKQARSLLEKGMAIAPRLSDLLNLQQRFDTEDAAAKAKVLDLLSKAGPKRKGFSAEPWAEATELYRQVLAIEPDNQEALEGLRDVAQSYYGQAITLKTNDALTEAMTYIQAAQDILPDKKSILEARKRIEEAIAWKESKRIETLFTSFKGTMNKGLMRESFPASRDKIYVSFEYYNFTPGAILTLVWIDGRSNARIREIPVSVTNKNGWQSVALEHPQEGFAKGNYLIDLVDSEGTIMASTAFGIR